MGDGLKRFPPPWTGPWRGKQYRQWWRGSWEELVHPWWEAHMDPITIRRGVVLTSVAQGRIEWILSEDQGGKGEMRRGLWEAGVLRLKTGGWGYDDQATKANQLEELELWGAVR